MIDTQFRETTICFVSTLDFSVMLLSSINALSDLMALMNRLWVSLLYNELGVAEQVFRSLLLSY